jgi:hypothetical protein
VAQFRSDGFRCALPILRARPMPRTRGAGATGTPSPRHVAWCGVEVKRLIFLFFPRDGAGCGRRHRPAKYYTVSTGWSQEPEDRRRGAFHGDAWRTAWRTVWEKPWQGLERMGGTGGALWFLRPSGAIRVIERRADPLQAEHVGRTSPARIHATSDGLQQ